MLRVAIDEDFNNRILRGLLRRRPDLDVVRVQDAGLIGKKDGEILEWASKEGRVILTHDVTTMKKHAYDRISAGLPMPGIFELSHQLPIGQAIEEILFVLEYSLENEWEGQVIFLPLK